MYSGGQYCVPLIGDMYFLKVISLSLFLPLTLYFCDVLYFGLYI